MAPIYMSALNQLILIVNLLHNRRSVSLKSIMEKCGISERTVYRYIDKISKAGIPLYYDRNQGGYTLSRYANLPLNQLDINEIILTIIALVHLLKSVDGYYKEPIENLLKKIETTSDVSFDEIVSLIKSNCFKDIDGKRLAKLITSSLLQTAIKLKTKANIILKDDGDLSELFVQNPKLKFDEIWRIAEDDEQTNEPISLSKVIGIRIK